MCGIVGYIGKRKKIYPVLLNGLKRLEYRGYDSAGIALVCGGKIVIKKKVGKIAELEKAVGKKLSTGELGIAHTRWATHGGVTDANAHPHFDCKKNIAIVHNGIIENYKVLKELLEREGHKFVTQTDSEVLAHLIEKYNDKVKDLAKATRMALKQVVGAYGLIVMSQYEPDKLVVARKGSPVAIGIGENEYLVASDATPILEYTKKVIYLDDEEIGIINHNGYKVVNLENNGVHKMINNLDWDIAMAEKSGFETFMLKEIFEQPESITNTLRGRVLAKEGEVKLGGLNLTDEELKRFKRIIITACGTSWHAALIGEYLIEELAKIPVEVEYASEFRYRSPLVDKETLMIAISQSGETTDTLFALREAKALGARTLGICNVVGSTIAREVDGGIYLHAGPEIGVASTKAFTSMVTALFLFAMHLAREKGLIEKSKAKKIISELLKVPDYVREILNLNDGIKTIARKYKDNKNFIYLGRGNNFPVALEGALKLKEISYIHAEGYPAAEMKHGPIALIDEDMPVVFIATRDKVYEKIMNNISEVKARQGKIIAVATENDNEIKKIANEVIFVPKTDELLYPILTSIPLQLLAYHIAKLKGCDVDKPRNLAKSVTVE
ncbi:glutamine--fructose-6-phosphate transaminase (isomerizing) [Candidatus Parcubacteria bacterium]|nr:MAG: glutamine--fructose-6-phosphate transaminase (isomerizing) [Candidatus Parcubacteria bacterium]